VPGWHLGTNGDGSARFDRGTEMATVKHQPESVSRISRNSVKHHPEQDTSHMLP
jgi:hypothetical protein